MVTSATGAVLPSSRALVATVVPWASDVGPPVAERGDALPDGPAGIVGRGQHLGHRAVGRHDVGEGASGVGTDPHGPDRTRVRDHRGMARLWSRKRNEPERARDPRRRSRSETVRLDDDDHAWWAQAEVDRGVDAAASASGAEPEQEERDILAEHFGDDWRTNFLYTGPTEEQLEEERRHEQQAARRPGSLQGAAGERGRHVGRDRRRPPAPGPGAPPRPALRSVGARRRRRARSASASSTRRTRSSASAAACSERLRLEVGPGRRRARPG